MINDPGIDHVYDDVESLEKILLGQPNTNPSENRRLKDLRISFQVIKDELYHMDLIQTDYRKAGFHD